MRILSSAAELSGANCVITKYSKYPVHLHTNVEIIYGISGARDVRVGGRSGRLLPGDLHVRVSDDRRG